METTVYLSSLYGHTCSCNTMLFLLWNISLFYFKYIISDLSQNKILILKVLDDIKRSHLEPPMLIKLLWMLSSTR